MPPPATCHCPGNRNILSGTYSPPPRMSPGPEAGGLQHETAPGRWAIARGYGSGAAAGEKGGARLHCRTGIHGGGGGAAGTM